MTRHKCQVKASRCVGTVSHAAPVVIDGVELYCCWRCKTTTNYYNKDRKKHKVVEKPIVSQRRRRMFEADNGIGAALSFLRGEGLDEKDVRRIVGEALSSKAAIPSHGKCHAS